MPVDMPEVEVVTIQLSPAATNGDIPLHEVISSLARKTVEAMAGIDLRQEPIVRFFDRIVVSTCDDSVQADKKDYKYYEIPHGLDEEFLGKRTVSAGAASSMNSPHL